VLSTQIEQYEKSELSRQWTVLHSLTMTGITRELTPAEMAEAKAVRRELGLDVVYIQRAEAKIVEYRSIKARLDRDYIPAKKRHDDAKEVCDSIKARQMKEQDKQTTKLPREDDGRPRWDAMSAMMSDVAKEFRDEWDKANTAFQAAHAPYAELEKVRQKLEGLAGEIRPYLNAPIRPVPVKTEAA